MLLSCLRREALISANAAFYARLTAGIRGEYWTWWDTEFMYSFHGIVQIRTNLHNYYSVLKIWEHKTNNVLNVWLQSPWERWSCFSPAVLKTYEIEVSIFTRKPYRTEYYFKCQYVMWPLLWCPCCVPSQCLCPYCSILITLPLSQNAEQPH